MRHPLQAVLFDLDGTLIDSLPDIAAAVNRLLAAHDRRTLAEAEIRPMIGDGADALVERAFAAATVGGGLPGSLASLLDQFLLEYEPRAAEATRPFPGVTETLAALQASGLKLAVCTNKPSGATHEVLAALGLAQYFAVVVGSDDAPALKPDPRHVAAVLDRLGVAATDAIMVGDSINDIAAAQGAGMRAVAVSFGYTRIPPRQLGADAVIDHFAELPGALAELCRVAKSG